MDFDTGVILLLLQYSLESYNYLYVFPLNNDDNRTMRVANTFWLGSEVVTRVQNLVFEDRDSKKRGILFECFLTFLVN